MRTNKKKPNKYMNKARFWRDDAKKLGSQSTCSG